MLTVVICLSYLSSVIYYVSTNPKQFQLLPDWLQEDLISAVGFSLLEVLSWFFMMWTGFDTLITSVFTWIFILFKFAASLAVILQSVLDMNI